MPKVLLADDSTTELEMMSNALKSAGFDVTEVENGDAALDAIKKERFDCIILDIIMPGKNGYQICRYIKKDEALKDIPVVIVTSKGQDSDKFWGKKQGADEYIVKPFEMDEMVKVVKDLLNC